MRAIYTLCPDPDSTQRLVDALRVAGVDLGFDSSRIVVVSGEPYEGYDFADEHAKSPMFALALLGGLVGGTCGYLITSLTQRAYPLPTGGMPIVPPWTNGIIVYELTMLGAILTTLVALFIGAHLPNFGPQLNDPEVLTGKILVGVTDPPAASIPALERKFREAGALEIREFPAPAAR